MICLIEGKLVRKMPMEVVVETSGVGYLLQVSLSTSGVLPEEGSNVRLFTSLIIRDDMPQLYGFATEMEYKLFQKMILIPGVGPKIALRILSRLTPDEILNAVINQDIDFLKKTPGIGRKIAERLIVELKDRIDGIEITEKEPKGAFISEAIEALIVLGYKRNDAQQIVRKTAKEIQKPPESLEIFLKEILKRI